MVSDVEDATVWFSPKLTNATIQVSIYSIEAISQLNVRRLPSGQLPSTMQVELVSHARIDHVTQYQIILTRITDDAIGHYSIFAMDESKGVTKKFSLFQVSSKGLTDLTVDTLN